MKNLKLLGKKWYELTESQKAELLKNSSVWDEKSLLNKEKCTIDLNDDYSIIGTYYTNENECYFEIDDNSIIYNSELGLYYK